MKSLENEIPELKKLTDTQATKSSGLSTEEIKEALLIGKKERDEVEAILHQSRPSNPNVRYC